MTSEAAGFVFNAGTVDVVDFFDIATCEFTPHKKYLHITWNVDFAVSRFQDYLSRNSENIELANKSVGNLEVQLKIEEASKKIVDDDYHQIKKDFENYMEYSIRSNDAWLKKRIKDAKLEIDIIYENIKCQNRFYILKALFDELSKNK